MIVWVGILAGPSCQSTPTAPGTSSVDGLVGHAPGGGDFDAQTDAARRRGALWYHLDARPDRLEIRVRLLQPPDRASFFLPGRWAGRTDFGDNISISGAMGPEGPVAFTISRSEGRIDVDADDQAWVELRYAVELRGGGTRRRFHPQFDDGVLFAYGPAFLVLPSEQISRQIADIPIEVRTPSDWKVLATWERVSTRPSSVVEGADVHGYIASDPGVLRDAFLAAGSDIEVDRGSYGENPLAVGFSAGLSVDRDRLVDHTATLLEAYAARYGALGPVSVMVRPLDDVNKNRRRGVGRRGGFVIEIPRGQPLDSEALLLLAHEAFHLWNGHHLTPRPAAEEQTRWFKEGVTHYVALKTLWRLDLFSREQLLEELSTSASYYRRNPAAFRGDATRADLARLPYDKGVLLALALDAALYSHSGGRVGLDTWLIRLLEQYAEAPQGYDAADLRAALVETSGSATSPAVALWDRHVAGAEPIDPRALFEAAGLHWLEGQNQTKARLLPLDQPNSPFQKIFSRPSTD